MRVTELNYVTCAFGVKGSWAAGYHPGVDFRAPVGTPAFAAKRGKVIHVGWGGWGNAYGLHVIVESWHKGRRLRHIYAHLSKTAVHEGQKVKDGGYIGDTGETGNTFGPHLHFEERHYPYGYYDHQRPVLLPWTPPKENRIQKILSKMRKQK